MAFPVPDHLPRKPLPTDVSSKILATISDTTSKSLTAEVAAEWVSELQLSIQQTKDRICDQINGELPNFERQLESSRSVQTRFQDLSLNVDKLSETLENPEAGTLPTLLRALRGHKELAQRASDARVAYEALSYLGECRTRFETLSALVASGILSEGVILSEALSKALGNAPEALTKADVMTDMKIQLRMLRDRMEEQLTEAYSRSVRVSPTELRFSPHVQVRQSQTIIAIKDVLASLSANSLNLVLSSLRRDIVAHLIDFPLQQSTSSNISRSTDADGTPSISLSIFPLPPSTTFRNSTPAYLKTLFDFLREEIFQALPPSASSFPQSFYKPTTAAILRDVLIPSIPSSLSGLPQFLSLVRDSVQFEQGYFMEGRVGPGVLYDEGEIRAWAKGVSSHYGRKRRVDILSQARKLILSKSDERVTRVEVSQPPESSATVRIPEVIPVQGEVGNEDEPENGWDFDDDVPNAEPRLPMDEEEGKVSHEKTEGVEEYGWDFEGVENGASDQINAEDGAQDDSDAWGWGDGEDDTVLATGGDDGGDKSAQSTNGHGINKPPNQEDSDDSAWDSAWDAPQPIPPSPPSPVKPTSPGKAPKVAKRLEKLTAKGKGKASASPTLSSNPPSSTFSASSAFPSSVSSTSHPFSSPRPGASFSSTTSPLRNGQPSPSNSQIAPQKPLALSLPQKPREAETYLISGRVQDLVQLVSDILKEGGATAASSVFFDFPLTSTESSSSASTFVLQTAPAALDLYRAVYPVVFAAELTRSARALRFANDCTYLHEETSKLKLPASTQATAHEQMREALDRLHALGTWWHDEGVERECERVRQILSRTEGFVDTGDQERFDECEAVMSEVLRDVRTVTTEWKTVLPRTKWLRAGGRVVETALARVIADVLALPDIPSLESRRLSELCRILNSLEALFVDAEDAEAPSMVIDYVPSWLKYSYLSELLEASIADISYLFDEGVLIDFGVEELVKLVHALFADTPLRANTISTLQHGHPVSVE